MTLSRLLSPLITVKSQSWLRSSWLLIPTSRAIPIIGLIVVSSVILLLRLVFLRLTKLPVLFKRVSLLKMPSLNYSTLISPLSRPFTREFFLLNLMVIFLIL